MPRKKIFIDRTQLVKLYWEKFLSTYEIGEKLGCSFSTITNRLEEYSILKKSRSMSRLRYSRNNFNGDPFSKAYMLGFSLGDLNIYIPKGKSETVVARCHTTQITQVNVMKQMFSKYGHVSVSNNIPGHFQINCFLDNSFKFLLDKQAVVLKWVEQTPATSWAFIAGYVDAEGNYIINQGRARFKVDSYDKKILVWMSDWLSKSSIRNKFHRIAKKGTQTIIELKKTIEEVSWRKDLWRLNINYKDDLSKFILLTLPYQLHETRINCAKMCLKNIKERAKDA